MQSIRPYISNSTARRLAQAFKERAYQQLPENSPSQVLLDLAQEWSLPKREAPPQEAFSVLEMLTPPARQSLRVRG